MRAHHLDADEQRVTVARAYSIAEGARLADHLLRTKPAPTAILTANDLLALGAYEAAAALGHGIPADLSVTGYNDMPFVDRLTPPLTTVRIQHYEMGAEAARLMLQRLERPDAPAMWVDSAPAGGARVHRTAGARGRTLRQSRLTQPPRQSAGHTGAACCLL